MFNAWTTLETEAVGYLARTTRWSEKDIKQVWSAIKLMMIIAIAVWAWCAVCHIYYMLMDVVNALVHTQCAAMILALALYRFCKLPWKWSLFISEMCIHAATQLVRMQQMRNMITMPDDQQSMTMDDMKSTHNTSWSYGFMSFWLIGIVSVCRKRIR